MQQTTRPDESIIPDPELEPTITLQRAAKAWGVSSPTVVYQMANDDAFPFAVHKVAGKWRVSTADLRRSLGMS